MRHLFALLFALLPTLSHGGAGASGHALLHGFTGCAAAELQGEGGTAYMCPSSGGTACVASFALGVHGADVAQAGMVQLITGQEVLPVGVQLMMHATGMNATQAGLAYDLVTLGFEMATVRAIANQGENALSLYHQQAFRGGANRTTVSDIGELRPPARPLLEGEDVLIGSAQGLQSRTAGTFDNVVQGTHGDRATTYLYTIDDRGVNIALESTPAGTPRGNIVHTNLSDRAAIGGEAWFGPNNTVTINAGSGRFGDGAGITQQQWDNTVRYWEGLRYTVNPIPFGRR